MSTRLKVLILHNVESVYFFYSNPVYRRKTNWICHYFRTNCLLKHVVEGKFEDTGRRGRRRKQLLINIKERVDTGN